MMAAGYLAGHPRRRRKAPAWTSQEMAILEDVYPQSGLQGAVDALPDRTWRAIYVMACKRQLRAPLPAAPKMVLRDEALEEAIKLREEQGWSFARIGVEYGIAETSASNAILSALCSRKGFTPAERDPNGRLTAKGLDRLRLALRRGIKPVDIQLRLAISAGRIAEERRRYTAELKAAGKVPLPPPGAGERYSGAKIPPETKRRVRQLLLEGLGAPKIEDATGVSKTHVLRQRAKLIRQLRRKGESLPGCDIDGVRRTIVGSLAAVPEADRQRLRALLMEGVPVARAAVMANMGGSFAYKLRNDLKAELEARGEQLPPIKRLGRHAGALLDTRLAWLPKGRSNIILYRKALRAAAGDEAEARRQTVRSLAIATGQDPALAEQIDRMRRGATAVTRVVMRAADPQFTLGGVATGALS